MQSSSCLPAHDWNSTKPPYWMNEGGLGLKTSARRETGTFRFLARFPVSVKSEKREKRGVFFSRLRTSANTKNSRLTREIPLVPRVKTSPSDPRAKRSLRTSRVRSKQKATKSKMYVKRNWMQRNWCTFFTDIFRLFFCNHLWPLCFLAPLLFFLLRDRSEPQKPSAYICPRLHNESHNLHKLQNRPRQRFFTCYLVWGSCMGKLFSTESLSKLACKLRLTKTDPLRKRFHLAKLPKKLKYCSVRIDAKRYCKRVFTWSLSRISSYTRVNCYYYIRSVISHNWF